MYYTHFIFLYSTNASSKITLLVGGRVHPSHPFSPESATERKCVRRLYACVWFAFKSAWLRAGMRVSMRRCMAKPKCYILEGLYNFFTLLISSNYISSFKEN